MSEETPNQSEERLQRYAKERRTQGGDFALHPATRQMLQGEVARTSGKSAAPKQAGWLAWLGSWTGRLAVGTAAVVVLTGSWVLWNHRLDQHTVRLARAEMPERKSKISGSDAARGFGLTALTEREFKKVDAPARLVAVNEKAAPAPQPVALVAANSRPQGDRDAGQVAVDKWTAVDALTDASSVVRSQTQPAIESLADEVTVSLAPVAQNYSTFKAPGAAQKPEAKSQQVFTYATSGGQNAALPGQAAGYSPDLYQKQSVTFSGEAETMRSATATFAKAESKSLEPLSKAQATSQLVAQHDVLSAQENRARATRPVAPAVPTAPPAAVTVLTGQAEPLSRSGGVLGGALVASGPTAAPAGDAAATRFYRTDAKDKDAATRSKALAFTDRSVGESPAVLSEFSIEQRGTTVRLVEADGSVYDGQLETSPTPGFVPGAASLRGTEQDGPVRELILGDKSPSAESAPRHQELSFRATGSNVTLRQTVVVNGRFSPGPEAVRAGQARPAEAPSKVRDFAARRTAPATSNLFTGQYGAATNATATIEGTVRIGPTNQQWFRALRRGP